MSDKLDEDAEKLSANSDFPSIEKEDPSHVPSSLNEINEDDSDETYNGSSDSDTEIIVTKSPVKRRTSNSHRNGLIPRRFVIREMLKTEEKYCSDLRVIMENFRDPLEKMVQANKPLLTQNEITIIFRDVEVIHGVDKQLLVNLENEGEDGLIGKVFADFAPFLRLYTGYLANIALAMDTLKEVEEDPARGETFATYTMQNTDAANLASLLIKPVQRVPQFELLLEELRKTTPQSHPDYPNILKAKELVHKAALGNNNFLEKYQQNEKWRTTMARFPEFPPNLMQVSRIYSDRLRHSLLGKLPVMVFQTEPSVAFDTGSSHYINETLTWLDGAVQVKRRNTVLQRHSESPPQITRGLSGTNTLLKAPKMRKSGKHTQWRMRELMVFDDLIAHRSTNNTGSDMLVEFLQYPVLVSALPPTILEDFKELSCVVQSAHGECWVVVSLTPGGRDTLVKLLKDVHSKSMKHPAGSDRVARNNILLARQWMGRQNTVLCDAIHKQVDVLVDMVRAEGGWRPFPLFHVPRTDEHLSPKNSGVMGILRSHHFGHGSVQLLSRPSRGGGLMKGRSMEYGTKVRVLAECVRNKERFFHVAAFISRGVVGDVIANISRNKFIAKLTRNIMEMDIASEGGKSDGKWVTGYVKAAQLCNMHLIDEGPDDPAVAAAKGARTTITMKARLTYGVDDVDGVKHRRVTKLNQYRIEPELLGQGATSVVLLGRYQTGYPVAIKKFNRKNLEKKTGWRADPKLDNKPALVVQLTQVREEIELLRGLRHPNVTRLLEVVDDERCLDLFLVLEYAASGPLMVWKGGRYTCPRVGEQRKKSRSKVMRADVARWYMRDLLSGLAYLHGVGVAHRDLKPENCLVHAALEPAAKDPRESEDLYQDVAKSVMSAWRAARKQAGFKETGFEQAATAVFTSVKRLPKYVEAKNKIIAAIDSKERYEERKHEVQYLMQSIENDFRIAQRSVPTRPPELGVCKIADFGVAHCFGDPKDLLPVSDVPHEIGVNSSRGRLSLRERAARDQQDIRWNILDGTQHFLAPECCEADDENATGFSPYTADIWALGVTLLACVTGRVPFWVDNPTADFMSPKLMGDMPPTSPDEGMPSPEIDRVITPDDTKAMLQLHNEGEALMQRILAVETSSAAWQLRVVTRWTQRNVNNRSTKQDINLLDNALLSILERNPERRITLHELVFHPWVSFEGLLPLLGPTAMRVLPPPWVLPASRRVNFERHWEAKLARIQQFLNIKTTRNGKRSKTQVRKLYLKVKEVYLQQVWRSSLNNAEEQFLKRFLSPELMDDALQSIRDQGIADSGLTGAMGGEAAASPAVTSPPLQKTHKRTPSGGKGFKMDVKALKYGFKEGWLDSDVCWLCNRPFDTTKKMFFSKRAKMFCRFCSRAVCKQCSTGKMRHPAATSRQKKRCCDECKLAKMLGNDFFKPEEEMQRLKQNRDIASVHLSSHGFQYKALHDCINLAAAENEVQGIFFVAFDYTLCKCDSTARMSKLREHKEDLRGVGKRDLFDWFGGRARLDALKQLIGKDLPALGVVTVVLGSGPVSDILALMERVDLLPPSGAAAVAAAESASASNRTRTPLKTILKTHGVAEISGTPAASIGKLSWFQMEKYISECYLRLMGRSIMQSEDDMRCFLAECQQNHVEEAQDVLAIPEDQTIVANVSTGLTNSDMKCVLDFFKRKARDPD